MEIGEKIQELRNISAPTSLEQMILDAIDKIEQEGGISESEEQQLQTIFNLYTLHKLTNLSETKQGLINVLATLGVQELEDNIPIQRENVDYIPPNRPELDYISLPGAFTEEKVLEGFGGTEGLPKFSTFDDFLLSQFFVDNYQIGHIDEILRFDYESWEEAIYSLVPDREIQKLQSMLIFLGYMSEEDLNGEYQIDESGKQEVSYFGVGGPKTFGAVELFQRIHQLSADKEVGRDTKFALYYDIYMTFHRADEDLTESE